MTGPEAERIRQELRQAYFRMMDRLEQESRISPTQAAYLGFARHGDDYLHAHWGAFRPDVPKPYEDWAP